MSSNLTRSTNPLKHIRFVVCTRDRPRTLELCLESLGEAFRRALSGAPARCFVFDDSTTAALSAEVRRVAEAAHCAVIGRAEQLDMERRLGPLPPACKALGQGAWDLAGVRNFAFLFAYCCSDDDDLLIFLDDDILLTSSVYEGSPIEIDGAALIRELLACTPARAQAASGARYLGRFDGSILDHLRLALDGGRDLCGFPGVLPVELALPGARIVNDGPGISGALLATTPAALASHFLPACYNEDWIWLALLGRTGAAVRVVEQHALHAAPPQAPVENGFVAYQNTGEAIYRAVRDVMEDAPPGADALRWCEEHISADHFLAARLSVADDIRRLLAHACATDRVRSCLEAALADVEALNPAVLYGSFRRYLGEIPAWRSALREARAAAIASGFRPRLRGAAAARRAASGGRAPLARACRASAGSSLPEDGTAHK